MYVQAVSGLNMLIRPVLLGGTALPTLFSWSPETAQTLPATSTFTRASVAQVLTTTDGTTFWYQEAKSGEVRLDGLRRIENRSVSDPNLWGESNGATLDADLLTMPAASNGRIRETLSGFDRAGYSFVFAIRIRHLTGDDKIRLRITETGVADSTSSDLTISSEFQIIQYEATFTTGGSSISISILNDSVGGAGTFEVSWAQLERNVVSGQVFGGTVLFDTVYNVEVASVRSFNTTNGNSVDGSGVVTEAAGTTITGGGYLPEPAATNLVTESADPTGYTVNALNAPTDLGVQSIGLNGYRLEANGSNNFHGVSPIAITTTGQAYSLSVVIEDEDVRYLYLRGPSNGSSSEFPWAVFDLTNGTVAVGTGDTLDGAEITDLGGGVYNCVMRFTTAASVGNSGVWVMIDPSGTVPGDTDSTPGNYIGASESVIFNNAQIEATEYPTSHIITSGSTVTRVADVLTDSTSTGTVFSFLCDITAPEVVPGQGIIVGFSSLSTHNVRFDIASQLRMVKDDLNVSSIKSSGDFQGVRFKLAGNIEDNNGIFTTTGGGTGTDGTGTVTSGTFSIGARFGPSDRQLRGRMHNVVLYGAAQTQSELEALTA